MNALKSLAALVFPLLLSVGCTSVPETQIKSPLTARPAPQPVATEGNGAIFQASVQPMRPGMGLFEDRRARRIGDLLTVNLVEKTEAKRKSETTDERKSNASIDIPVPTILGRVPPSSLVGPTTWAPSSSNKIELKDNETNSNEVKGSITVTVVDVLANGNLMVAGEKQVRVNQDTEYIRLAGVVNPDHITPTNTIQSTQLADVQLESTNAQKMDKSQYAGILARFFLTLLPF